ncbi:MAG: 1-deoxy-D-xylulose-5-phosphate synthase [Bacteroidales bacterium]|nr:1-deoxy-D-xylulose-5-phosphate synthase [Bacteroidales bacterium]
MYKYLDSINSPADLRKLDVSVLPELCAELRDYIVRCCADNPGHLASSLGTVEMIVAVHYVFDTPEDNLVFDVGHQAYAHKILTGRREAFASMRREGGISGFPSRGESIYDAFGVGHSSTSVSAALGFAEAARIKGSGVASIAFIGDGALTGGLAFEGLNNAGVSGANLVIVLNDNNQSVDRSTGAVHNNLLRLTTSAPYNTLKNTVWSVMGDTRFRHFIMRVSRGFKSWIVRDSGGDFFESLGLRYFGPVDGSDVIGLVRTLRRIRDLKGPRVLHCITKKGFGYRPAENDPTVWHYPGRFDVQTGGRKVRHYDADRYQDVFGQVLCDMASSDGRVVGITPAMATGSGMTDFAARFPDRFFDVGIEEEHAVTFSAGLAAAGLKPFCAGYATFAERAYDQVLHDVALQGLPVVLCLDRAGLVGEDGATHNGVFDIAAFRSVPGTVIACPRNEIELKNMLYTALGCDSGPFIIRYPRGCGEGVDWRRSEPEALPVGKAETLLEGSDVAIVATGHPVNRALEAALQFAGRVGVYDFRFVKPLDGELLCAIAGRYRYILTVEDGVVKGGLFGAVCEFLQDKGLAVPCRGLGVGDDFVRHASQSAQRAAGGLDTAGISAALSDILVGLESD